MRIRVIGHAGLFVRAGGASVLCDPWFNRAYFGSWYPFPDNAAVDVEEIGSPDYLYISHLHKDHFDATFLADHVDKSATVLLPDFPLDELRRALEALGFHRFVQTRSARPVDLEGLRVAILTTTLVSDGPIGDSALVVDDGANRIVDQNDCHPRDMGALRPLGPFDLHLLQCSGAIWYPMVYRFDAGTKAALCREKRERQAHRAMHYMEEVGARHVIPFAGPPAFLDDALFELNDVDDDPANIFQDQASFLRLLAGNGRVNGHLAVPGTEVELVGDEFALTHPVGPDELEAIFSDKRDYLRRYQARRRPELDTTCPRAGGEERDPSEVVGYLARLIEPLLDRAPTVRAALGGPILLDVARYGVLIDPARGLVTRWEGEEAEHGFHFDESLLLALCDGGVTDWVNQLFLSCRFEADRRGPYNEVVFSFFKCLTPRRMAYLESSLALARDAEPVAGRGPEELWRCGPYLVQRHCPHLGADLSRFGDVEDGVLTCTLHGRRFDLRTGECLSGDGPDLFTVPADSPAAPDGAAPDGAAPVGEAGQASPRASSTRCFQTIAPARTTV